MSYSNRDIKRNKCKRHKRKEIYYFINHRFCYECKGCPQHTQSMRHDANIQERRKQNAAVQLDKEIPIFKRGKEFWD